MRGFVQKIVLTVVLSGSFAATALSEDLIIPLSCKMAGRELQIAPAAETAYHIIGRRSEQSFVACGSRAEACETMMVHRFVVDCAGEKVSWARIANASLAIGVSMPSDLPNGFAPVSPMAGRFVLPALTEAAPSVTPVSMQSLLPETVTFARDDEIQQVGEPWVTVVSADRIPSHSGGSAMRLASALIILMSMLFAASMVAAGRWRVPVLRRDGLPDAARAAVWSTVRCAHTFAGAMRTYLAAARDGLTGSVEFKGVDDVVEGFNRVSTRISLSELRISTLPPDLLLRDVLTSELQGLRRRLAEAERQSRRRAASKSASILRVLTGELNRIDRIAQSGAQAYNYNTLDEAALPKSVGEAYRVLGINVDSAPSVAKKLVDALRMSWHPDHARDEYDRLRREERMKQINAAWDIINGRREAA